MRNRHILPTPTRMPTLLALRIWRGDRRLCALLSAAATTFHRTAATHYYTCPPTCARCGLPVPLPVLFCHHRVTPLYTCRIRAFFNVLPGFARTPGSAGWSRGFRFLLRVRCCYCYTTALHYLPAFRHTIWPRACALPTATPAFGYAASPSAAARPGSWCCCMFCFAAQYLLPRVSIKLRWQHSMLQRGLPFYRDVFGRFR